jgi:hypothetical protein
LADDLTTDAVAVPIVESTEKISTTTGFYVHNSVTLRIDNELITFGGVNKTAPFGFTTCKRGALGTQAAAHSKNAKVYHLKECFGLFVPDPATTLFEEVAARTAEAFNTCGFDMIYLDALDGEGILGGPENAWHFGSRYVYEICKRLERPALMEMSTFHHHLWCVRSRIGAWDHPRRSHKKFIDSHCAANAGNRRMFLPGQLGWWSLMNWGGAQTEPTFSDDIEYLMAKCLGTDTGFALMGIDPNTARNIPSLPRLATIIRRFEDLRHSGKVPEAIKAKLRTPGDDYTLVGDLQNGWQFRPARYAKHKVENASPWSSQWKVTNTFAAQPLRLRIQALMAAGPYDAVDGNLTIADFKNPKDFAIRAAAASIHAEWKPAPEKPTQDLPYAVAQAGDGLGVFYANSERPNGVGSWSRMTHTYAPPQNLTQRQALGFWVYGDGKGETLNVQLKSPEHLVSGVADHYIVVDFTGWRYFELIEPEGDRYTDYQWPYVGGYDIYRESVQFGQIETLGVWYNNLPTNSPVQCLLSPIKAMPLVESKLINPILKIGEQSITLPVEIPTGHYLELLAADDCVLYGPNGEVVRKVELPSPLPTVQPGENAVQFEAKTENGLSPRAYVTVITQGDAIGGA